MDNYFLHGVALVFYFYILWIFQQMAYAAWGSRRAKPQWIALVNTGFMQSIRIKWLSLILALLTSLQIMLVVGMLGISAYTGRPITFD